MVKELKNTAKTAKNTSTKQVLLLFSKTVLTNKKEDPKSLVKLLNASDKTVKYDFGFYEDLLHRVDEKNPGIVDMASGKDLKEYDLVYQRRWSDNPAGAASVATYLHKIGVTFVDGESDYSGSIDKLSQHWKLWANDLPFPSTVFVPPAYVSDWIDSSLTKTAGFPMIMKGRNGTRGNDNHLVSSVNEAQQVISKNPKVEFLIQEYIPNDGDYRVFVTGGEIALVIHRQSQGKTHKNNTSQGGTSKIVDKRELTPEMQTASIKAAKIFGRNIAGVDLVIDSQTGKFYFFEVNRAPQIIDSSFSKEKAVALSKYFTTLIDEGKP